MNLRRLMLIVVIAICPAVFAAAGPWSSPACAGAASDTTPVIYGGSSWLGHYPVWVGIESGFFRRKGIQVRFRQFYASSSRMGALISGNIHVASTGAISGIALMASGVTSFHVIGTQDSYATVEGIIARRDIRNAGDLKGKKLAVTFASSAHVLVLDILSAHGLDPNRDVKLINLKVSEMPAAFRSGEIDACALWTPMFNKVLAMEGARLLLDDRSFSLYKAYGLGPGPDILVMRKDFPEKQPAAARAFLEAYFESIELLKQSPETCARQLLKLTGLSFEAQLAVLKDITWHGLDKQRRMMKDPGLFVEGLQKLGDFLVAHGQIDRAPKVDQWVNTGLLPESKGGTRN